MCTILIIIDKGKKKYHSRISLDFEWEKGKAIIIGTIVSNSNLLLTEEEASMTSIKQLENHWVLDSIDSNSIVKTPYKFKLLPTKTNPDLTTIFW